MKKLRYPPLLLVCAALSLSDASLQAASSNRPTTLKTLALAGLAFWSSQQEVSGLASSYVSTIGSAGDDYSSGLGFSNGHLLVTGVVQDTVTRGLILDVDSEDGLNEAFTFDGIQQDSAPWMVATETDFWMGFASQQNVSQMVLTKSDISNITNFAWTITVEGSEPQTIKSRIYTDDELISVGHMEALDRDILAFGVDPSGNLSWHMVISYNGSDEYGVAATPALGQGVVLAGHSDQHSDLDIWVLGLNRTGVMWGKEISGPQDDYSLDIGTTSAGAHVLLAASEVSGDLKLVLSKMSSRGEEEWTYFVEDIRAEGCAMTLDPSDHIFIVGNRISYNDTIIANITPDGISDSYVYMTIAGAQSYDIEVDDDGHILVTASLHTSATQGVDILLVDLPDGSTACTVETTLNLTNATGSFVFSSLPPLVVHPTTLEVTHATLTTTPFSLQETLLCSETTTTLGPMTTTLLPSTTEEPSSEKKDKPFFESNLFIQSVIFISSPCFVCILCLLLLKKLSGPDLIRLGGQKRESNVSGMIELVIYKHANKPNETYGE